MKENFYTKYDNECIVYLAIQIIYIFGIDNMYIDLYYDHIINIYNDYKKHDNKNLSLLDSINRYINDNKDFISNEIRDIYI